MPVVNIQFPSPGETLAARFITGGTYDTTTPEATSSKQTTASALVISPRVECKLFNDTALLQTKDAYLNPSATPPTWWVVFDEIATPDNTPTYKVEARLFDGTTTPALDSDLTDQLTLSHDRRIDIFYPTADPVAREFPACGTYKHALGTPSVRISLHTAMSTELPPDTATLVNAIWLKAVQPTAAVMGAVLLAVLVEDARRVAAHAIPNLTIP